MESIRCFDLLKKLKQEHILIVGFSYRTGLSVAQYFKSKGICFSLSDRKSQEECDELLRQLSSGIKKLYFGSQGFSQLLGVDRIILSPGVPKRLPLIQEALSRGIPVMSEIELAYLLARRHRIIGITGTDGKSTTTRLVTEILKQEYSVKMAGNIGFPFISLIDELQSDSIVVLELSSYMLELVDSFRCDIACILNVSEDHLDRYLDFGEYLTVKKNIFKNQTGQNYAILNWDDPYSFELAEGLKAKKLLFSNSNAKQGTSIIQEDQLMFRGEKIMDKNQVKLLGEHNLYNILAAICITKVVGISNKAIKKVLGSFTGLKHRMEFLGEVLGVQFINDSKATTIQAVSRAILSLSLSLKGRIILLMGGRDKGISYAKLLLFLEGRVSHLILFGEVKKKIDEALGFSPTYLLNDLEESFYLAVKLAGKFSVVLLSPGASSFDMYDNYQERGDHFRGLFEKYRKSFFKKWTD